MTVSVITPTANRPWGLACAERWMARQTRQPEEWVVADGGETPARCTRGQRVLADPRPAGPQNFAANILRALEVVTGDVIVVWEDDDWYAPTHLEALVGRLEATGASIAGDDDQRYYHVGRRCWRRFENRGGCFCQTAFRRALIPVLQDVVADCVTRRSYGVDTAFWARVPPTAWSLARDHTVLGLKGLPGQVGLGLGHRPDRHWTPDPELAQLRAWIGADADVYAGAPC